MKKIIKWIIIIGTILIFAYAFSASYNSQNIDSLDYIIAIGVDTTPNSNNLQITFEFTDLGAFADSPSSESSAPILDTVIAPSLPEAINLMNAYEGRQINLSHCKVIVFSEEIAKLGILKDVTYLMNSPQIRPTTNIVISAEEASNYIENSTSSLESVLTKYYDIFPTSAEYTGYTSNILLGRFYQNIINPQSGAVAILGNKSNSSNANSSNKTDSQNTTSDFSQSLNKNINTSNDQPLESIASGEKILEGDRGTENIGLAVFKDNSLIGKLSAMETLCYTLIEEEVDNFLLSVDNPFEENKKIDLSISSLEPAHIDIDLSGENPIINIKFNLTAKALTGQDNLTFSKQDTLTRINDSLKNFLKTKMSDYLYKTSREFKCDLNGFYRIVKRKFLTLPDYQNYNWEKKYQDVVFNVDIDSNVISSFLVQNS